MPTGEHHACPSGRAPVEYVPIIFDPCGVRVLAHVKGDELSFPRVSCPEIPHRGHLMSECFSRAIHEIVGVWYDLNFLFCDRNLVYRRDVWGSWRAMFAVLGPYRPGSRVLAASPMVKGYEWVDRNEMEDEYFKGNVKFASDLDLSALQCGVRIEGLISEEYLRPWERPLWYTGVTENARKVLEEMGIHVASPFEQYQISSTAAVLRVLTDKGQVYLKASTEREGAVMQLASSLAPELVRRPLYISVHKTDAWFLMDDYGTTLDDKLQVEDVNSILKSYGKLQRNSMRHIAELVSMGLEHCNAERLFGRVRAMLEDEKICNLLGKCDGFSSASDRGQVDLTPYRSSCRQLLRVLYEENRAPITLVHGDLHDSNIVRVGEKSDSYILLDWGSARIDVPFTDVNVLGHVGKGNVKVDMASYFAVWADYGSVSELEEMSRFVSTKDKLLIVVDEYERSKKKSIEPSLIPEQVDFLRKVLDRIHTRMTDGKWPAQVCFR